MTMERNESIERFEEGLKKASSRARELGKAQNNSNWEKIAIGLDQMRSNGMAMYHAKAISRATALALLDKKELQMGKTAE